MPLGGDQATHGTGAGRAMRGPAPPLIAPDSPPNSARIESALRRAAIEIRQALAIALVPSAIAFALAGYATATGTVWPTHLAFWGALLATVFAGLASRASVGRIREFSGLLSTEEQFAKTGRLNAMRAAIWAIAAADFVPILYFIATFSA